MPKKTHRHSASSPSRNHASDGSHQPTKTKWSVIPALVFLASVGTVSQQFRFLNPATFMQLFQDLDVAGLNDSLARQLASMDPDPEISQQTAESYGSAQSGNWKSSAKSSRQIISTHESLVELTRAHDDKVTCPSNLKPVEMVSNPEADAGVGRKIPKIVHMTGKTKCLTNDFWEAAQQWKFENHSFYFHDDLAVMDLLNKEWPMFPQLKNTLICLENAGGAALADIWRYLALYEYGGIYTDMDNLPNTLFNSTSIDPDTDAYFLQEGAGFLSQYFFAISPKHPLMFLAVQDVMSQMHSALDIGNFYVPFISGPGATKRAFLHFMGLNGTNVDEVAAKYSKPGKGHYIGVFGNHSVSVVSTRRTCQDYVIRTAIAGAKKMQGWKQMNITNYQAINKEPNGITCVKLVHDYYANKQQ